jgi:hypothetical protein
MSNDQPAMVRIPTKNTGIYTIGPKLQVRFDRPMSQSERREWCRLAKQWVDRSRRRWALVESGEWLDMIAKGVQADFKKCDDPVMKSTASEVAALCKVVRYAMAKDDKVRMTWHAFELGRAAEKLSVLPSERFAKSGREQSNVNAGKAAKRWEITNRLAEKVREKYRLMIDRGHDPAETKKTIHSELSEDWTQFKQLRGARKDAPSLRTIQVWTQNIKPRYR